METDERSAGDALLGHRGFVRALARSLVDGEAGEDVAQDALVAALSQAPRHERAWRAWLRSTVRHLASNLLRSRRRVAARERAAARPERLPSTATLVERLELEQRVVAAVLTLPESERAVVLLHFYDGKESAAIAARLDLPADTVRARLRRALARLRTVLDRDCGDRGAWVRGLAPLLGWKALPLPLPVAATPLVASTLEVGAAVMGAKGIAALLASAAAVAAACFVLPGSSWRAHAPSELAATHALSGDVARDRGTSDTALAAPASGAEANRESVAVESDASDESAAEAAAPLPPPGEVTFRVVDARTRAPLDAVTIRFQSERRFAQYDGGGEGSAKLTSGAWTGRVVAAGHEPVDLGAFAIEVGVTRELGTVELVGGGGLIEGRVTARTALDRGVKVELFGEGRAPCDECGPVLFEATHGGTQKEVRIPTACCGFELAVSSFTVADGERFSFRNLAAGVYWLRAVDDAAQLADVRRVDLARNGALWFDLDVSPPTSLVFELRHADGHRFAGVWSHPHRAEPAAIRFDVTVAGRVHGSASATPDAAEVAATIGPPIPIEAAPTDGDARMKQLQAAAEVELAMLVMDQMELRRAVDLTHSLKETSAYHAFVTRFGNDRLDRERTESDSLEGDAAPPELQGITLPITPERPDRFVVGALPRELVTVRVSCGSYASAELAVDLRHGFTGPLVVTLLAAEVVLAPGGHPQGAATSCASCHAETPEAGSSAQYRLLQARKAEIDLRAALDRFAGSER